MADANTNGSSVGVVRWDVIPFSGVGATGTVVVGISPYGLNLCAYDVAVDAGQQHLCYSMPGWIQGPR